MQIKLIASIACLIVASIYIGLKVFLPPNDAVDFKFFWLAGDLWQSGIVPYGPIYLERAQEVFTVGSVPPQWAYPPHFRPISELLALAPLDLSAYLWRFFNVTAVAGGVILLIWSIRPALRLPVYAALLAVAVALTMSATAISVAIGQSSPLIFLGYGLFAFGYLTNRPAALVIALIVLMVKPTYGFIPAFFLLAQFRYFRTIVIAALITVALSAWGLGGEDIRVVLAHVLDAFSSYTDDRVNSASEMTGLRHLVYLAGLGEISQLAYVLAGSVLAFCLGWAVRDGAHEADRIRAMMFVGLLLLVFAPLHTYDGYFALAVVIPALALTRAETLACFALLFVTWRSNNLAEVTGMKSAESLVFTGSTLEAFAATLALIACAAVFARRRVAK